MAEETQGATMEVPKTYEEFEAKVQSDSAFRDAFLKGEVKYESEAAIEEAPTQQPTTTAAVEPPPKPQPPQAEVKPVEEEPYLIDLDDGTRLFYRNRHEAQKAIAEKERYIRQLKNEDKTRNETIAELQKKITALESNSASAKPSVEVKQEEALDTNAIDPFDVEYHKKVASKVSKVDSLEAKLAALEAAAREREEADKKRYAQIETDRNEERLKLEREKNHANQISEANAFLYETPELRTTKSVEALDDEYSSFLDKLGAAVGTDGKLESNLQALDKLIKNTPEVKAAADAKGVVLTDEMNKYIQFLNVANTRARLFKDVPDPTDRTKTTRVAFTLKETYNYLQSMNGGKTAPVISDRVAAIEAAEKLRQNTATDIGGSNTQPNLGAMSEDEKAAIINTPIEILRRDPNRKKLYEEVYRSIGMTPPPID